MDLIDQGWTDIQIHRLKELNATTDDLRDGFTGKDDRNRAFQALEKHLVRKERERLSQLLDHRFQPQRCRLESNLIAALNHEGFTQVTTPTIISQNDLCRMSIDKKHPLNDQIYWVDSRHCLRPMLAPNLYRLMKDLVRIRSGEPIRIFEIGSCFRKETDGARHIGEFTMLNLVEMKMPMDARKLRMQNLATLVMKAADIDAYKLIRESSEVYDETIDIVCGPGELEVASCAMGPHLLDDAWEIVDTWVGLGFGLERLLMAREGSHGIGKWSRSLAYIDGIRLTL